MKHYLLFLCLLCLTIASAQEKMMTKTGKIMFEASVPSFEEVKATNNSASCVLNPATGEIGSLALMKGFKFKIALMEEHFNENYVVSDKYPKATFKGHIEKFSMSALTATPKEFKMNGKMELHGKTKMMSIPAKIRKTDDGVEIISDFTLNADDFAISIPAVVKNKVSKNVDVHCEFTLR